MINAYNAVINIAIYTNGLNIGGSFNKSWTLLSKLFISRMTMIMLLLMAIRQINFIILFQTPIPLVLLHNPLLLNVMNFHKSNLSSNLKLNHNKKAESGKDCPNVYSIVSWITISKYSSVRSSTGSSEASCMELKSLMSKSVFLND